MNALAEMTSQNMENCTFYHIFTYYCIHKLLLPHVHSHILYNEAINIDQHMDEKVD